MNYNPFFISVKIFLSRFVKIFIVFSIVSYLTFYELRYYDNLQIFLFNIFLSINYMCWQMFCVWCRKMTKVLIRFKERLETGNTGVDMEEVIDKKIKELKKEGEKK